MFNFTSEVFVFEMSLQRAQQTFLKLLGQTSDH